MNIGTPWQSLPRAKNVADAIRGSVVLLALFSAFIAALGTPVYLFAGFVAGLGAPTWLTAVSTIGLCIGELCAIALMPNYLDRRDDRRERQEIERSAGLAAHPQASAVECELDGRAEGRSA